MIGLNIWIRMYRKYQIRKYQKINRIPIKVKYFSRKDNLDITEGFRHRDENYLKIKIARYQQCLKPSNDLGTSD
ncbi:unnamed protein product [Paramecium primaurelia]|uniref:Uncharacterized protein n=1 Tax=Paramecium primaurelia TaxID=5886 RepID=A0A8S1PQB7_PARPR|nr:unnamed protein product [Paramecium primaurelia]